MLNGLPNSPSGAVTDVEGPSCNNNKRKKKQGSGVTVNLLHKLTELVAYTSAVASEAYHNLTGNSENNDDYDEVMQINTDDDFVDSEPPPPYDSTWSLMTQTTSSSPTDHVATPQPTIITTNANKHSPTASSRRKQIRVHRGRRLIRHRSSSNASMPNSNALSFQFDDEDDEFLRFNYKLMDLIVEGKAALTSTVVVTDVEFLMSEEREREERIMRELGIQTPVTRRSRSSTCSSMSSDSDSILSPTSSINSYYGSLSGHPSEPVCSPTQYEFPVYFKENNCSSANFGYIGCREDAVAAYSHELQYPGDFDGSSGNRATSYGYVNMY